MEEVSVVQEPDDADLSPHIHAGQGRVAISPANELYLQQQDQENTIYMGDQHFYQQEALSNEHTIYAPLPDPNLDSGYGEHAQGGDREPSDTHRGQVDQDVDYTTHVTYSGVPNPYSYETLSPPRGMQTDYYQRVGIDDLNSFQDPDIVEAQHFSDHTQPTTRVQDDSHVQEDARVQNESNQSHNRTPSITGDVSSMSSDSLPSNKGDDRRNRLSNLYKRYSRRQTEPSNARISNAAVHDTSNQTLREVQEESGAASYMRSSSAPAIEAASELQEENIAETSGWKARLNMRANSDVMRKATTKIMQKTDTLKAKSISWGRSKS